MLRFIYDILDVTLHSAWPEKMNYAYALVCGHPS